MVGSYPDRQTKERKGDESNCCEIESIFVPNKLKDEFIKAITEFNTKKAE